MHGVHTSLSRHEWLAPKLQKDTQNITSGFTSSGSKSFLHHISTMVTDGGSAQQQKMQSRKRTYSSEKKCKNLDDERVALLGLVRRIELKEEEKK
jgi:hypothetical protein